MVKNKNRKNDNRKINTTLYLDTGNVHRNRPQHYGDRSNKQNSQFNNFPRWENPNHPRRNGRYDLPGPRHNTEYHSESRFWKSSKKKKKHSRPSSPLPGSEEHMKMKIDQTSAIIMRHLLSPNENIVSLAANRINSENEPIKNLASGSSELLKDKSSKVSASKKKKKKLASASSEEIHDKIMHHLSNLNDGKKRNLINSSGSVYDETIQRIVKQKRIEISRALRSMCSETSNSQESTDYINSIIPDIGIKIEDLPKEILQELQSTFEIDIDSRRVENFATMNVHEGLTTIMLLDSDDDSEEEANQPQIQGQINDLVDSATEVALNSESNFEEEPVQPQIHGQINYLVGSTNDEALHSESNVEEGPVQSQIQGKINYLVGSTTDAAALHSESNVEEGPVQSQIQGKINYLVGSTTDAALNSESNVEEEPVQPQIQGQIPSDGDFEKSDFNNLYNFSSNSNTVNSEIDESEKECRNSSVTHAAEVPEVAMIEPEIENETGTEAPLVSGTATEVSEVFQSEFNEPEPRIKNEIELEIPLICISACKVIPVEDKGRNIENEHSRNIVVVRHEMERSSDVGILEEENRESRMHVDEILSEDEDNPWISGDRNNDCPIRLATEIESTTQNTIEHISSSTQTSAEAIPNIKSFLEKNFPESPQSLQDAVKNMMVIDKFISELVKYRQGLFSPFLISAEVRNNSQAISDKVAEVTIEKSIDKEKAIGKEKAIEKEKATEKEKAIEKERVAEKENSGNGVRTKEGKKNHSILSNYLRNPQRNYGLNRVDRRIRSAKQKNNKRKISDVQDTIVDLTFVERNSNDSEKAIEESPKECTSDRELSNKRDILDRLGFLSEQNMLQFQEVKEKMLLLKVFNETLLAATETGKIFFCSLEDGHYTQVLEVTKVPITSLLSTKEDEGKTYLHVGSFENSMKVYNFENQCLLKSVSLTDSVRCMDADWGYIFLGCMRGTIIRYCIKKGAIEYEEKFTNDTIFVIKPAKEGVRRVLLIGSRNAPVVIRAAMSGLHLRTMENVFSHTVYSLIIEKNLVYCGTPSHNILVFNFHDGTLTTTLKATESKGVSCLKIVGKLLFASCHNGKIYVYNVETNKFIGSIEGPGGVILSMEVLDNQVVVGTMAFKLASIPIPQQIMKQR